MKTGVDTADVADTTRRRILTMVADGEFHSGTAVGEVLGISRAAVNKAVQQLVAEGHEIHSVTGRGYRLAVPIDFLDYQYLSRALAEHGHHETVLYVLDRVSSTSRYLVEQHTDVHVPAVCLAEHQTAGRGRRGRQWRTTPYRNLMLSVSHQLPLRPADLTGLSLAMGVAAADSLHAAGFTDVGLKWPNDLLCKDRKLGGVLVDLQGESEGPTRVVVGLGVNVHISEADAAAIDQAWTDLRQIGNGQTFSRNALAAAMMANMLDVLNDFERNGFDQYRDRWQSLNVHAGKQVALLQGNKRIEGMVEGVDQHGALLLRNSEGMASYHSGEVSLRPQSS